MYTTWDQNCSFILFLFLRQGLTVWLRLAWNSHSLCLCPIEDLPYLKSVQPLKALNAFTWDESQRKMFITRNAPSFFLFLLITLLFFFNVQCDTVNSIWLPEIKSTKIAFPPPRMLFHHFYYVSWPNPLNTQITSFIQQTCKDWNLWC